MLKFNEPTVALGKSNNNQRKTILLCIKIMIIIM